MGIKIEHAMVDYDQVLDDLNSLIYMAYLLEMKLQDWLASPSPENHNNEIRSFSESVLGIMQVMHTHHIDGTLSVKADWLPDFLVDVRHLVDKTKARHKQDLVDSFYFVVRNTPSRLLSQDRNHQEHQSDYRLYLSFLRILINTVAGVLLRRELRKRPEIPA